MKKLNRALATLICLFLSPARLVCSASSNATASAVRVNSVSSFMFNYTPSLETTSPPDIPSGWGSQGDSYQRWMTRTIAHAAALEPVFSLEKPEPLVLFGDKKRLFIAPAQMRSGSKISQVALQGRKSLIYSKGRLTQKTVENLAQALAGNNIAAAMNSLDQIFDNTRSGRHEIDLDASFGPNFQTVAGRTNGLKQLRHSAVAIFFKQLERQIGEKNIRRLQSGWVLSCWRMTTPHNWFLYRPGKEGDIESLEKAPSRELFEKVRDSEEKVPLYWGFDSGQPRQTIYRIRPEVLKLLPK